MEQEHKQPKIEGYSNEELKEILVGNTAAFLQNQKSNGPVSQPTHAGEQQLTDCATLFTDSDGKKTLEISFGKKVFASQVGQMGLSRNIERSLKNPSEGIRDFFTTNYDDQSRLNIHDKEKYLNLSQTGEPGLALTQITRYVDSNRFNSAAIDHLKDATISNMKRIHSAEREARPTDTTLAKRHETEVALWALRESEQLGGLDSNIKENFREVLRSHLQFKEAQTGKKLPENNKSDFNDEYTKFTLKESLSVKLSRPKMII